MKKRALVVGIGGMRGAYDAGVAMALCRVLGPDHFDAIYACSAGVYAASHFALGQPDSGEDLWRDHLDGSKFLHFTKPFRRRNTLDLEYLTHLLCRKETFLHIERLPSVPTRLTYVLTEQRTGTVTYVPVRQENILDVMNASCALPFLHPPIVIDGIRYIDGGLSDPLPFQKALADGCDEVVVVYNKPEGFFVGERYDKFSKLLALGMPRQVGKLVKNLKFRFQDIEQGLLKEKRLKIIRPKVQLPLRSILDTNKARLNACVDMGIASAKEFLKTYRPL